MASQVELRHAEVQHLDVPALEAEEVERLEVEVKAPCAMGVDEGALHFTEYDHRLA